MTATDAEVWALVERLGSQSAAARTLDVTQGAVRTVLLRHAKRIGVATGQLPGASIGRESERPLFQAIARVLERAERTESSVDALAAQLERIEAKLDELLARPIGVAFQPTHRRVADGGRGGRHERREALRAS